VFGADFYWNSALNEVGDAFWDVSARFFSATILGALFGAKNIEG
jgi:hypothetical protein